MTATCWAEVDNVPNVLDDSLSGPVRVVEVLYTELVGAAVVGFTGYRSRSRAVGA
ncbi:hypothetical protein [Streptomyces sp. NPDC050704]|uniref:hypothetical protein n=1 Tax=Streptomyces sp. NPDC050704 TaxID=3157219 RepID=UPI00341218A7